MCRFSHLAGRCYRSVAWRGVGVASAVTSEAEHLARMRVEYGSVEKDGSPDLDADWLPTAGSCCCASGWPTRNAPASPSRTPWSSARSTRGKARHANGVVQERGRNRHHLLHQLRLGQGRAAGRARRTRRRPSRGTRSGARCTSAAPSPRSRPRRPPTTGPSGRAARSWGRGRRTSRSRSPRVRRCSSSSPTSPSGSPTSTPCQCRRTGVAT